MRAPRCLGVLGGTGPAATAHMHALLVASAQRDYAAAADQDFPALLVFNTPLPASTPQGWSPDDAATVRDALLAAAQALVAAGAHLIVPACNTIDIFVPAMAAELEVALLSLPALAAGEAQRRHLGAVGILSSRQARTQRLHADALSALGIKALSTDESEQDAVDALIERLMHAPPGAGERARLRALGQGLQERGAEAIIIGCTELSLCAPTEEVWIDGVSLAVAAALRFAYEVEVIACA